GDGAVRDGGDAVARAPHGRCARSRGGAGARAGRPLLPRRPPEGATPVPRSLAQRRRPQEPRRGRGDAGRAGVARAGRHGHRADGGGGQDAPAPGTAAGGARAGRSGRVVSVDQGTGTPSSTRRTTSSASTSSASAS